MKEQLPLSNTHSSNKIAVADGVRGLAVIIVLLYHAFGNIMISLGVYSSRTGIFGVIIFFVLSSFLLSNKFLNKGFGLQELVGYFLGRFIRIIPLFILASYLYYQLGMINYDKMLSVLNFSSTYAHLWTIPLEFKFYFILPFIVFLAFFLENKIGKVGVFVGLSLIACLSYITTLNSMGVFDSIWSPVFIIGIVVCFIYRYKQVSLTPILSDLTILSLFCVMIFMTPAMQFYFFGYKPQLVEKVVFLWSVVTSAFCYFCFCSTGMVYQVLKGKFLTIIGKWSFSIYLFHWAVIIICAAYKKNDLAVFAFSVVQSIGLGALIYYVIEAPVEKLRHLLMNVIKSKVLKWNSSVNR